MSNEAPTDALRLVPVEPTEAMQNAGVDAATNLFEGWVDEEQVSTLYRAMLAAAPASPLPGGGWQDISTAPKDGTDVLVFEKGALCIAHWNLSLGGPGWLDDSGAGQHDYWNYVGCIAPTHWMPLPAAPTGKPK